MGLWQGDGDLGQLPGYFSVSLIVDVDIGETLGIQFQHKARKILLGLLGLFVLCSKSNKKNVDVPL